MTRKIIPFSLNLDDEIELKLFQHLQKKSNRSKYLKRLIYDDLMGVKNIPFVAQTTTQTSEEDLEDDSEAMESFL